MGLTPLLRGHYTFGLDERPSAWGRTPIGRTLVRAKKNVATQETTPAAPAWIHAPDAHTRRQKGSQQASLQGQAPAGRLATGTFRRDQRLRRKSDFVALRERGISRANPLLVLRTIPNALGHARFGFVIGRRVAKRAVDRNRLRRRLREIVRRMPVEGGWDALFIARRGAVDASFQALGEAVDDVERRAGLLSSSGSSH